MGPQRFETLKILWGTIGHGFGPEGPRRDHIFSATIVGAEAAWSKTASSR